MLINVSKTRDGQRGPKGEVIRDLKRWNPGVNKIMVVVVPRAAALVVGVISG
jgi:hypothetical protein